MKKMIGTAVATAVCSLGLTMVSAPAHADSWGCVTKKEFYSVKAGWSRGRVASTFDTAGSVLATHDSRAGRDQVIAYPKCPSWGPGQAGVEYDDYGHDQYRGDTTLRLYDKRPRSPWSLVWW